MSRLICDQSLGINYKVGECDIAITLHSNKNKSSEGFILCAPHVPAVCCRAINITITICITILHCKY